MRKKKKSKVDVVWTSDIVKKQEETTLSFYFAGVYLRFGLEKLKQ